MVAPRLTAQTPELWAGVECTVNRVGDSYSDQLERSGHAVRVKDLERLAELGVRTIRYPILWERTAPEALDRFDWSWADERLDLLQQLGSETNCRVGPSRQWSFVHQSSRSGFS